MYSPYLTPIDNNFVTDGGRFYGILLSALTVGNHVPRSMKDFSHQKNSERRGLKCPGFVN
jgi:hypothetical protein